MPKKDGTGPKGQGIKNGRGDGRGKGYGPRPRAGKGSKTEEKGSC